MTERASRDLQALYMRLYFDEDVSRDIVENLRQRGFDVLSARDAVVVHKLLALLDTATADEMRNQLRYI
jgi:hypothetical protein